MAKAIWWLSVIICALVNHLNPYHMEEIPFVVSHYYTSTLGVDDPAAIYASFFAMDDALYQPCNPANRKLSASEGTAVSVGTMYTYFIPSSDKTGTTDGWQYTYNIPEDQVVPILAPMTGYIITDPASSVDSTMMDFKITVTDRVIKFANLDHWYCCHGHTKYNGVGYKHCAISSDDFSKRYIQAGEVLGYANSKTCITILDADGVTELSFKDFFETGDSITWNTLLEESTRIAAEEAQAS